MRGGSRGHLLLRSPPVLAVTDTTTKRLRLDVASREILLHSDKVRSGIIYHFLFLLIFSNPSWLD